MNDRFVVFGLTLVFTLLLVFSATGQIVITPSEPDPLYELDNTENRLDENPNIATDGNGNWMIVWLDRKPEFGIQLRYELLYSFSNDDGETWSDPATIFENEVVADYRSLKIETGGNGIWLISYKSYSVGYIIRCTTSNSNSDFVQFSDPISEGIPLAGSISFETDRNGTWMITSSQTYSISNDDGLTWSQYEYTFPLDWYKSDMASGGNGVWGILFQPQDFSPWEDPGQVFFSRSVDNGLNWETPVPFTNVKAPPPNSPY